MPTPLEQHQLEIETNAISWAAKPLLRDLYAGFYAKILDRIDTTVSGAVVEVGSGIGNLRQHLPSAICSDLFASSPIDVVCDGYELPFQDGGLSHLILFDVFHHLQWPCAFLEEAKRVLTKGGRLLLFEPFLSVASFPVYGIAHHEPVAWRHPIEIGSSCPPKRNYYAAQGNATRLFFRMETKHWLGGWEVTHAEAFSAFAYLLSGGYSKRALYPARALNTLSRLDDLLSRMPRMFAGRCLVELRPTA